MYGQTSQGQSSSAPLPIYNGSEPVTPVNMRRGKDKDVFDFGDLLLLVHTDRISALGSRLSVEVAGKGHIVNQMSAFWFGKLQNICPNHLITVDQSCFPVCVRGIAGDCEGRAMLVWKTMPLPIRCVVRGYLAGAGWREYQETGAICGNKLPAGLVESQRLPSPIFTPTTKGGAYGKNENISFKVLQDSLGSTLAEQVRETSLRLYFSAWKRARERGVLIADTKFEFGLHDGKLMLIDECLTPDTSRFWPMDRYRQGGTMASMDKQMLTDYLDMFDSPETVPSLPEAMLARLGEKYRETYRLIVGKRYYSMHNGNQAKEQAQKAGAETGESMQPCQT